jgi:magnesium transporter
MGPADKRPQRLDWLFYLITDSIVDEYLPLLDEIAEATTTIEHQVLRHPDPPVLRRIFELKRQLIDFRRVTGNMREVANAIMRREGGFVGDDLDPYFRDVYDHLVRVLDLIESYRDILTGTLDIYLSAVANRTNEVMKVLTLYGTIAIPLVVITGFFGMNLKLPWAEERLGALYAVGVMLASVLVVLAYLNRKRWF